MRTATLMHGQPEYARLLTRIRQDPALVAAMWADAESRPDELDRPGTRWSVTLVEGSGQEAPAAWCAARQIEDRGVPVLKCHSNYEVPAWRGQGLYAAAYRERHRRVVHPSPLPAFTYLFPEPIGLHIADGWQTTGLTGPGEVDGHTWWELRHEPN
jgi:hypothetical protein